jgi:hypothetical protein
MKPKTFQDWIDRNFGEGIARVFLNPYNFKVWAYKPEQMSAQWMGERVPVVDVKRIVRNITVSQKLLHRLKNPLIPPFVLEDRPTKMMWAGVPMSHSSSLFRVELEESGPLLQTPFL